jgi:hypothetical protein
MLTPQERERVTSAMRQWAQRAPNEPIVGFLGTSLLTPKEMVTAVEEDTSDGQAILEILEHGVRREGLDAVVDRLKRQLAVA